MSKSKLDLLLNIARWLLLVSGCIFIVFGILVISLEHISSITSDVEFSPTPIEELNEGPEDDPDYRWEVKYKFKALNALYESSQYLKGKKKELRYTMKVGYVSFCPSINWIEPMDRKLAISMFGFIPGLLAISLFLIMTLKQKKVASPVQIESKEEIKSDEQKVEQPQDNKQETKPVMPKTEEIQNKPDIAEKKEAVFPQTIDSKIEIKAEPIHAETKENETFNAKNSVMHSKPKKIVLPASKAKIKETNGIRELGANNVVQINKPAEADDKEFESWQNIGEQAVAQLKDFANDAQFKIVYEYFNTNKLALSDRAMEASLSDAEKAKMYIIDTKDLDAESILNTIIKSNSINRYSGKRLANTNPSIIRTDIAMLMALADSSGDNRDLWNREKQEDNNELL